MYMYRAVLAWHVVDGLVLSYCAAPSLMLLETRRCAVRWTACRGPGPIPPRAVGFAASRHTGWRARAVPPRPARGTNGVRLFIAIVTHPTRDVTRRLDAARSRRRDVSN